MHRNLLTARRTLAGLAAAAGLFGGQAVAQPPQGQPPAPPAAEAKVDKNTGSVLVPFGSQVRFTPPDGKNIKEVFIRTPNIAFVRTDPTTPRTLVLFGQSPGVTALDVRFEDGGQQTFTVVVQPDYALLEQTIRRSVPNANVQVVAGVGRVIILTGFVTQPEDAETIVQIARRFTDAREDVINNIRIGGSQHVSIEVTIAQVDRTELRERGTAFAISGTTAGFSSVLGGLGVSNVIGGAGVGVAGALTPSPSANLQFGIVPAGFVGALRALKTEGLAKFTSSPAVVTQTGRTAFIRVGGQQATLGPAAGINGPGAVLENVGTQVEVLPIVFGNGKIYVEVNPQFRSVNNGRGITTAFGFTPGFNEQQTRSSVMLESGQTYAIGGLIESQTQGTAEKVPVLGELPLLGAAFSSVRYEERETELLVLVTPRLVDALDCNQVPRRLPGKETRSPDDYELFLESLLEAPRGQRMVWQGHRYVAAYKNDPSYNQFPCAGSGAGCAPGAACAPATPAAAHAPAAPAPAAAAPVPVAPVVPAPVTPAPVAPAGGAEPAVTPDRQ